MCVCVRVHVYSRAFVNILLDVNRRKSHNKKKGTKKSDCAMTRNGSVSVFHERLL